MKREEIFDYNNITFAGKVSLLLGYNKITQNLKNGNWLDILSGYKSILQQSQINNPKITEFYSLDHSLNKSLKSFKFNLKELTLNKKLPYNDDYFDNITIINGLEHLWHPQDIINECYRITKENGRLQIIVPTWFGKYFLEYYAFKIKNKQALIEMNDHKMYYDITILWPMLVKAGFKPQFIKIKRIKFFMSLYATATKDLQS